MTQLDNLIEDLQKFGLGKNEATIYLAALTIGPETANNLAKYADIKRPTAYLALDNLIKIGLVTNSYYQKKKLFKAEPPQKLQALAKRMRRKVIEVEILTDALIKDLSNIHKNIKDEPKITLYNGINGIKNVLLSVSSSKTSWYVFGSSTELLKYVQPPDLKEILEEGEKIRQTSGRPKIYFITDSGILNLKEFQEHMPERREIKILPSTIKSGTVFIVFQDKLAILNLGAREPFGAVIKSPGTAEVIKVMFKLLWNSLK